MAVYRRGRWLVSNISDVRIMWNITAPSLVPVEELTRSSSPSNVLPEAVSEVLGISLSEVQD
jgi:hypothetical protein